MKLLIRGGMIYDGGGAPPFRGDVLTEGDRITAAGPGPAGAIPEDCQVIEAGGRAVCPGFVDIHRHADAAAFISPDFGKTELAQGISSAVTGNCGMSPVPGDHPWRDEQYRYMEPVLGPIPQGLPFENYRTFVRGLRELSLPLNLGFLAGAGAIKTAVKGFAKTPFSREEMARAVGYVEEALDAGALGLSFGIMYQPECYSSPEELAALARPLHRRGGILCTHIRGEGDSLVNSVAEMIAVAEAAGVPLNISHFKSTGIKNWGNLIYGAIEKIEAARAGGLEVTADFYPYDGGATTIMSLLPPDILEESVDALRARLAGPAGRDMLRREIGKIRPGWDNMVLGIGWDRILISSVSLDEHAAFCGKSMGAIAGERGFEDPADLLRELVMSEGGRVGIIVLSMAPEDIDAVARLPWTCLISDSLYGGDANPHPRLNGSFPKFLREYVREKKLLSMETAIRKMTAMPAERAGLKDRGLIGAGYYADLLVFDPGEFTDHADYARSRAPASGMDTVVINGRVAVRGGEAVQRAGRPLLRGGK